MAEKKSKDEFQALAELLKGEAAADRPERRGAPGDAPALRCETCT